MLQRVVKQFQFQQIRWPASVVNETEGTNYSTVHCYTELNSSFVGRTARLIAEKQLSTRSCMIRIPTHTRLHVNPQGFRSRKVGVTSPNMVEPFIHYSQTSDLRVGNRRLVVHVNATTDSETRLH